MSGEKRKGRAKGWIGAVCLALCVAAAGCASSGGNQAGERGEKDAKTAFGGALNEAMRENGMGVSAQVETGQGAGKPGQTEKEQAGPGMLFYVYVGLGALLLVYLIYLIARKSRRKRVEYESSPFFVG